MQDNNFYYIMLGRLQADCDYYLGCGNRDAKHCLWAGNEQAQINEMRKIWNNLNVKPEWLTLEQINEYAKQMGIEQ